MILLGEIISSLVLVLIVKYKSIIFSYLVEVKELGILSLLAYLFSILNNMKKGLNTIN